MKRSKLANRANTFQTVPRAMRRRTASHNPKRVPKRLRGKALQEFIGHNTPLVVSRRRKPRTTKARLRAETAKRLAILAQKNRRRKTQKKAPAAAATSSEDPASTIAATRGTTIATRLPRPKIRRNKLNEPLPVKSKFRKRQVNKTWLPTHVWHAKRARMTDPKEPLWRFAIPLTPNEKTYRPTHRAQGQCGAVIWDMSYMSTIGLYGHVPGIERVLRAVGVCQDGCWNGKGKKWRLGSRAWTCMLSRQARDRRRDVCPAVIVWDPEPITGVGDTEASQPTSEASEVRRIRRRVFFRVHPSAFLELFTELVRLIKMETPRLYVEDLRFEVGSIEITGAASTESLLGVLRPFTNAAGEVEGHGKLFQSLAGLTNVGALPAGALLSFSVQDPRLRYPPQPVDVSGSQCDTLLQTLVSWPAEENLKPCPIWDRDLRLTASRLPSQKSIDRRKGSKPLGTYLEPTAADAAIPVLLISHVEPATRTGAGNQIQGTWTLLAPWKCIQPIWHCLCRYPVSSGGNPRLGGLDELRQVSFERGRPWFPADFPATDAGAAWELAQRARREAEWNRRPKSRRVEWQSLDLGAGRRGEIGNGLWCDWDLLFPESKRLEDKEGVFLPMTSLSRPQFGQLLRPQGQPGSPLPSRAIVQVRLTLVSRGVATACARIYRLPREVQTEAETEPAAAASTPKPPANPRDQWISLAGGIKAPRPPSAADRGKPPPDASPRKRKRHLARSLLDEPVVYPPPPPNRSDMGGHPLVPDSDHVMGFVISGSFCLSQGKAVAMGAIAVANVVEDLKAAGKGDKHSRFCVVRNAGESIGRLARWEVV
jgi:ribonuclease P/MRP protein subunit POP1